MIREWLSRVTGRDTQHDAAPTEAASPVIDFTHRMGIDCCVREVHDGGARVSLYGWTHRPIAEGAFILLGKNDGTSTRYLLTKVERCFDPPDMWFGEAAFAPRWHRE